LPEKLKRRRLKPLEMPGGFVPLQPEHDSLLNILCKLLCVGSGFVPG
jgi:hypothetical protein